jgi:hypothetical protein
MMPGSWKKWSKWAFLGIATGGVILTSASDEGRGIQNRKGQAPSSIVMATHSDRSKLKQDPQKAGHLELERLSQAKSQAPENQDIGNVFNATTWYVPPPPPPPPGPPPKPTAPPMPFTFLGRYEDSPRLVIILSRGDRVYTVSEGDVIDGTYRVDQVTDSSVELMYLPLNIKQTLSMSAS